MTLLRMDHVGINFADLEAAVAFFVELGFELQGEWAGDDPLEEGQAHPGDDGEEPGVQHLQQEQDHRAGGEEHGRVVRDAGDAAGDQERGLTDPLAEPTYQQTPGEGVAVGTP